MPFRLSQGTLVVAINASLACVGAPVGPSVVATGVWGGDHIMMTVADTATHVEFDCAHGDVSGALVVDGQGQFNAVGTFVREHGGPIRQGEVPDSHPATFAGSVSTTTMALTIRLTDTGDLIGAFTLARGTPGRVVKCLLPLLSERAAPTGPRR